MKNLSFLRLGALGLGLSLLGGCKGDSSSATPAYSATSANSASPGSAGPGGDGKAGSMARFAILDNTLYAVDHSSLRTFDLSTPTAPTRGPVVEVGMGVETIFPRAPHLFIGTQQGMFIYAAAGSAAPQQIGSYTHVTSCDPVVVDGRYAYVTLRNGTDCRQGINQLDVIDLADLRLPRRVRSYPMTQPFGLGADSSLVFVCDQGIKVFDARTAPNLHLLQSFNIAATDVIAHRGVLLVTGADGLYQYRYSAAGAGSLQQLSRIPIVPRR